MPKETPEDKRKRLLDRARRLLNFAICNYGTKPIGDTSRWFEREYAKHGMQWPGKVNPDAPLDHEEEIRRGLLPKLEQSPEEKWVKCALCGVEWKTRGQAFPPHLRKLLTKAGVAKEKKFNWPTICVPCADAWDARGGPPPGWHSSPIEEPEPAEPASPLQRQPKLPYKDPKD